MQAMKQQESLRSVEEARRSLEGEDERGKAGCEDGGDVDAATPVAVAGAPTKEQLKKAKKDKKKVPVLWDARG